MTFVREALPSARSFYQKELGKLRRSGRGWYQALCPFHPDKHPSLYINADDGHFICHACQAKGHDVIAFTRLRYNLNFKDACKELGCWDETSTPSPEQVRRIQRERQ